MTAFTVDETYIVQATSGTWQALLDHLTEAGIDGNFVDGERVDNVDAKQVTYTRRRTIDV